MSREAPGRRDGDGEAGLEYVTRLADDDVEQLHRLYAGEWWSRGRTLEEVRFVLERSPLVFGFRETASGRLVAFARALSDGIFKATLFDVIVAPAHRGRGVGAALMRRVLADPRLAGVRHVELYCLPELVPFYAGLGFSAEVGGVLLMRREAGG